MITNTHEALKLEDYSWYHSIDFGNGIISKGRKDHKCCVAEAETVFRYGVAGKSVIDIGAWSGFFSFEADRRGASRVLSTDSHAWQNENGRPAFDYARSILAPNIEDMEIDIMNISPDKTGKFDVVLFLGVLYHMRHPFLALENAASVCDEQLIIETHLGCSHLDFPAAEFYPRDELGNDPSNWWGLNKPAIIGMLENLGFSKIEYFPHPISTWSENRGILKTVRDNPTIITMLRKLGFTKGYTHPYSTRRNNRGIFHAFR